MKIFQLGRFVLLSLVLSAVGCEKADEAAVTTADEAPREAGIPAMLFAEAPPAEAVALIDAKGQAKEGDHVIFEARVGGRQHPFVEGRAIFTVADPSLLSCAELHGDTCRTPWDYCCEPSENLLKHIATVQVVDEQGMPLKRSLENEHGLTPLTPIVVTGTVDQVDESGNFVVNAESIYVKES